MDIFPSFFTFFHIITSIQNVQYGCIFYHFPHHPYSSGMCNMAAFFYHFFRMTPLNPECATCWHYFTVFLITPFNPECATWRAFLQNV
jgi:hypothetical protein